TLLSGSFSRSRDLIQRMLLATSDLYEQALHLDDLFIFFSLRPTIPAPENPLPVPRPIRDGFEFRDVWFRYPPTGSIDIGTGLLEPSEAAVNGDGPAEDEPRSDWVLRGVNFRIRPGERWALVGENGAGKTTLVKLLLRLYEPTRGEILLDGHSLSAYDPAEYHRVVSVILQAFVRFDMLAEENITMDRPSSGGGAPSAEVVDAAERALAAPVIDALPQQYGTMLGRRFEGGIDLSGGQWQKIALARSYLRDA